VKRTTLRKTLAGLAAFALAGGLLAAGNASAPAATPHIVAVGSHADEQVMDALLASTGAYNIYATPSTPQQVPADGVNCNQAVTYAKTPVPVGDALAPNGANPGRDALRQGSAYDPTGQVPPNNGCVSIARSSSAPRKSGSASGTDSATFQYYAFAIDAVSWASPSLSAPAVLAPAQILGIYNCTYTNWSQVGGGNMPIQRFEPQPGSGTRSFFESAFLGGLDPTTISGPNCPPVITTQPNGQPLDESDGLEINPVTQQRAIIPYEAGEWGFQANNYINPSIDDRYGVQIGGVVAARSANNTNNTGVTDGSWAAASTTVSSTGSNFLAGDAGATIAGGGIPAGDVIQSVNGGGASVTLASSGNTRSVTDGITNKTIPCINSTAGSKNITINTSGGSLPATPAVSLVAGAGPIGDVGAVLSIGTSNGSGITDGTTIASVTDSTHAVLSANATVTNNGTSNGANSITLYLDGGQKALNSNTAAFVPSDVGKVISGDHLPAADTVVGVSGDGKTAFLSTAVANTSANTQSNHWTIDDPTTTAAGASPQVVTIGVSTTSNGSTTLTTANGHFSSFDIGATVTGAGIPGGTTISAVSGNTATLSAAATATPTPSVTVADVSELAVNWDGPDQIWVMNTPTSGDSRGPVDESNIAPITTSPSYPGIRYMFNVIDLSNPYYSQTLNLVGFSDAPGGTIPATSICSGSQASTIDSYGFQALDTSNPGGGPTSGPNSAGSNCRYFQPS
jgi:hypothetical protein